MNPRLADGDTVPVLVVGGGPTGVTAATMLARRGIRTLVVDRFPDVYPLPRAVHLDDEVYRILQSIGAADDFARITMPTLGMRLLDAQHRTMAEFRRSHAVGEHGYPPANMFDQPDLERVLRAALARQPLATLACGVEVLRVEQDLPDGPAPVRITLRDTATDTESTVWAHAVLGCDGANSVVRAQIGATLEDLKFEERWLVIDIRSEQQLPVWQGVHQVCDPRRAATFMQVGPSRYRWEFRLGADESTDDLVTPAVLERLVRPWLGDVPFAGLEVMRTAEYVFKARVADRWRDRRVFLLGDAAHLTPPFIGQGLCSGLRDAANLTWKLADVLDGVADEGVLDTYEAERAPHARALVKKAVTVGWVMTGGQDNAARVRRVVLKALCALPGFTDKALDAKPPRFGAGPLVQRVRGDKVTGTLVPQPQVTYLARQVPLDTVLGDGSALVVGASPRPGVVAAASAHGIRVVQVLRPTDAVPLPVQGVVAVVDDGTLTRWLGSAHARAVLVRPDRVVQAVDRGTRASARALDAAVAGMPAATRPASATRPAVAS